MFLGFGLGVVAQKAGSAAPPAPTFFVYTDDALSNKLFVDDALTLTYSWTD